MFGIKISFDGSLQASVYGIGVCAEFGGAAFKPLVGGGYSDSSARIFI